MPIYLYTCKSGHTTEEMKSYEHIEECPKCQECGKKTKRALTTMNISYGKKIVSAGDDGYPPTGADWERGDKLSQI